MSNREKSYVMARLAQMAYKDLEEAKPTSQELGYKNHVFIDNAGAQVHIVWNKEELVLCFRGTEPTEFNDIKADLNAWPDKAHIGRRVHNGFQTEVDDVWPLVLKTLDKKLDPDHKIYICGHSLGGAMATIAASRLQPRVNCLYTFGSPRVGAFGWHKLLKVEHYRYVNNNDIVPTVPFVMMGYGHHGTLCYINHYGELRKMTTWQRIKDKIRGYKAGILDGLGDHNMDNYIAATEKAYGKQGN